MNEYAELSIKLAKFFNNDKFDEDVYKRQLQ